MSKRRLFELTTEDGCSISPYVWRTKFALAGKNLPYETEPVGFTQIAAVGDGSFRSLPVLQDGGKWIGDSWAIADYLNEAYPDAPLFASPGERGTAVFFEKWYGLDIVLTLLRICIFDIHNRLREADRPYFREIREKRLGQSLEAIHEQRDQHVRALPDRLLPLRLTLRDQPFVGGEVPAYVDYIAAGAFIWAGSVATTALLPPGDDLLPWLRRCLALHGGVGADISLPGLPGLDEPNGV
jgi:glutathione S-transferase